MKYPFASCTAILAALGPGGCHQPSPQESFEELFGFPLCESAKIDAAKEQTESPASGTAFTYMVVITMPRSCIEGLYKNIRARTQLECFSGSCTGRFKDGSLLLQDQGNSVYVQYDV